VTFFLVGFIIKYKDVSVTFFFDVGFIIKYYKDVIISSPFFNGFIIKLVWVACSWRM